MTKNRIWILLALLIATGLFIYSYIIPQLQVVAGYSVKCGCTNHFYTDRTLDDVLDHDLGHMPVSVSFATTDSSVTASVLGIVSATAVRKGDIGCVLLKGEDDGLAAYYDRHTILRDSFYHTSMAYNRRKDTLIDYNKLDQAIDNAFDEGGELTDKKTRAVVILHNGKLIGEQYAIGENHTTPMIGWSMSKSLTNTMIGLLIKDGKLSLDDNNLFPEWENDNRKNITINNLLQMSSGLEWEEDYTKVSSATEMLFRTDDVVSLAKNVPLSSDPGTTWYYASGSSNLLSGIAKRSFTTLHNYHDYIQQRLFNKIGMKSAFMETDEKGTYIGSSYTYATARDWARYGQLHLQDGIWQGNRLLPEDWIHYTRTVAPDSRGAYGAHWWLNRNHAEYPDAPDDLFSANGYQGQRIFVLPSQNLVIVRLGFNSEFDHNTFLKEVVASTVKNK